MLTAIAQNNKNLLTLCYYGHNFSSSASPCERYIDDAESNVETPRRTGSPSDNDEAICHTPFDEPGSTLGNFGVSPLQPKTLEFAPSSHVRSPSPVHLDEKEEEAHEDDAGSEELKRRMKMRSITIMKSAITMRSTITMKSATMMKSGIAKKTTNITNLILLKTLMWLRADPIPYDCDKLKNSRCDRLFHHLVPQVPLFNWFYHPLIVTYLSQVIINFHTYTYPSNDELKDSVYFFCNVKLQS